MEKKTINDIYIDETDNSEISAIIKQGILDYNAPFFGSNFLTPFTIYMKDLQSEIIAGLTGSYRGKYVRVDFFWVHKDFRHQGLGSKLMMKLEEFSKAKECRFIQLDTFDFQARPFYEKLGFECVGTIPRWIEGQDFHFMRKAIV
ncbi:GNAT family N-acetyltransferase [Legionella worsleiensis]|uniref:Putative acetyltransferase n=1 Tax=Legionella worsleiensis TaxID=45076 RepID=A0A0W1AHG8_9GAMM|nr:GNAT family N-acetyltransferase [Legionella worsleiensis]KTD80708.1 putative acetyltransferase [Legionella worsleiensis]STY32714.1 acetyltransferase [Legionella worsleiensis]